MPPILFSKYYSPLLETKLSGKQPDPRLRHRNYKITLEQLTSVRMTKTELNISEKDTGTSMNRVFTTQSWDHLSTKVSNNSFRS